MPVVGEVLKECGEGWESGYKLILLSRIWDTPDAGNEAPGVFGSLSSMDQVHLRLAIKGDKQSRDDSIDLIVF